MRPNFLVFIILCSAATTLCLSVTDEYLCKTWDEKSSTFTCYCTGYSKHGNASLENCKYEQEVPKKQVLNFGIHGCTNGTVRIAVQKYVDLNTLDISLSGFQTMDSFNYSHSKVEKFNMSHNEIVEYRWTHFMNLLARFPQLKELDLSHNKMQAVHVFVNQSIIKLGKLHLHHNSIMHIQRGAFVNLTELEQVDFSHNKLSRIFANAFSNAPSLHEVHLEHNPIDFFECEDLLNEKVFNFKVHVSWDHVEYFNTDCVGIDVSSNPGRSLIRTKISQPGLLLSETDSRIECGDQSFKQIRAFKAGPNKYRNVLKILPCFGSELLDLDLSGNKIDILDSTFEPFDKLTDLSLSQTQLKTFDFQWLQLQKQLISLDISYNGLQTLENVAMSGNLRSIETLNVAGNSLNLLDFVQRLPDTIKNLDVSSCGFVGVLKPEYFKNMPQLEELRLRNLTRLLFSHVNPFASLENLNVLDISHNYLRGMDLRSMSSTLEKLREFRATDCYIDNAANLINEFGMDLWTLDLSGNYIGNLLYDSPLQKLNLLHLYLNHADISIFDLNTLSKSSGLAYFEIAHNSLTEIDLTPLSTNVMELKMQNNQLNTIVGLTPEHFKKLRYLNIGQNELPCDYLIEFANDFARKNVHFEEWDKFAEACLKTNENDGNNNSTSAEAGSQTVEANDANDAANAQSN